MEKVTYTVVFAVMPMSSVGETHLARQRTICLTYQPRSAQRGLRIFSPQIDANDSSHVSFRYETIAGSGTVDVRLDDQGDLVFSSQGRGSLQDWVVYRM